MIDTVEMMKIFRDAHEENLVPRIEKCKTPTSEPEDKSEYKLPVHIITDEVESVRTKEILK